MTDEQTKEKKKDDYLERYFSVPKHLYGVPHCLCSRNPAATRVWVIYGWLRLLPDTHTPLSWDVFAHPIGEDGRVWADTNVDMVARDGKFLAPYIFRGTSVHCVFGSMNRTERERFRQDYMLSIAVKDYYGPNFSSPRRRKCGPGGYRKLVELPLMLMPEESFVDRPAPNDTSPAHSPLFQEYPICIDWTHEQVEMLLVGKPFKLSPEGKGLQVLIAIHGEMDTAVQ